MSRLRILLAEPDRFSPEAVALLESAGAVDQRACTTEELGAAFADYDAIWFRLGHRITAEMLSPGQRCRVLATPVTGLDHIDLDACRAAGVRVVSLKGETEFLRSIRSTAELAVALTLAVLRKIPAAAASVESGVWDRDLFPGNELSGKTVGIVGVGRLGTIAAEMFAAFGTTVIGYDPRPDYPDGVAERMDTLTELTSRSDIVSIHVDYKEETHELIDAEVIGTMKPTAILVNTARGGVVDEEALIAALDRGAIAGAGLDVVTGEPTPPADHPLFIAARRHQRLVIVPHLGGNTVEAWRTTESFLANRVVHALTGVTT